MAQKVTRINYRKSNAGILDNFVAIVIGFAVGFIILYLFYRIIPLCIVGGVISGIVNIFINQKNMMEKRKRKLRIQFFDLLEAMSVAMRAGNPPAKALESARESLALIYAPHEDIMVEMETIIGNFRNAILLSRSFSDLAERSGLEDIETFASIYATIEGKSSRADEIVREVQEIIGDKMEVEMEIETLMTAAKSQMNVMCMLPLVILFMMGNMGGGFLDAIYEPGLGRVVATVALIIFIGCYFMGKKFAEIEV